MNPAKDKMYPNDAFSQWMGMEIISATEGKATVKMTVRTEMLNGFKIAHGGITYALADSAFAFASNSYGEQAVSIETSISHTKAVYENDVLTAKAEMVNRSRKIGQYDVRVTNQNDEIVALFKGTVYQTGKPF